VLAIATTLPSTAKAFVNHRDRNNLKKQHMARNSLTSPYQHGPKTVACPLSE
jgi:hypothetical protein